jgi:hypothetical protein
MSATQELIGLLENDECDWYPELDEPRHTGQDLSPLSQHLDKLQIEASERGEVVQHMPPGPAVVAGALLSDTLRAPRLAKEDKEWQEFLDQCDEYWPKQFIPSQKLVEQVKEAIVLVTRERETQVYMKGRPRRIKNMRGKDGRIKGIGIPPSLRKRVLSSMNRDASSEVMTIKQLEEGVWKAIDQARHDKLLEWDPAERTWKEYEDYMEEVQERMNAMYKGWRKLHKRVILPPIWEDENVTYPVRNRIRKYMGETYYKMTYHSHGIPQFYDKPRGPTLVPRPKRQYEDTLTACFQCQLHGTPSRCKILEDGCYACERRNERCLTANPWDVREVKRGNMKMEDTRGWWVDDNFPETFEGDMTEEEKQEMNGWVKWFRKERFEVMEWVGGEKGFVKRNVKKDSWALPRFEKDELGRPERDGNGKPIPFRS